MDNKEKIKLQEKKIREKREQNTTKKTPDTKDFDRQTYIEKLTKFVTEEEEKKERYKKLEKNLDIKPAVKSVIHTLIKYRNYSSSIPEAIIGAGIIVFIIYVSIKISKIAMVSFANISVSSGNFTSGATGISSTAINSAFSFFLIIIGIFITFHIFNIMRRVIK